MRASPPPGHVLQAPVIHDLSPDESLAVLARGRVGRLAFAFRNRVDIQPVHYVYDDGFLYGRTSQGAKLVLLAHNPWVAFEVDEMRATFDWDSVVVKGSFHVLDPEGNTRDHLTYQHAIALLRTIVPHALREGDPTPWRDVVFRISVDEITGRRARPGT